MFRKIVNLFVSIVHNYLPDPFLFAGILTVVVFGAGVAMTGQTPLAMAVHWGNGAFSLLAFSMQMALVLVTGHTLASTPIVKKFLGYAASIPKSPKAAIVAVTAIATLGSYINWGFGLVVGALYARELARKVKGIDYRLLIASAYSGFVIWHSGLSGSIPLLLATGGPAVEKATGGVVKSIIPISETLFAPFNVAAVIIIAITMPLLNAAMHPDPKDTVTVDPALLVDEEPHKMPAHPTFADKLENSPIMSILIGLIGITYLGNYFATKGFGALTLDVVNMTFLIAGIILHGTPRRYLDAFAVAAKGAAAIILQFPFYAGIMGMMVGSAKGGTNLAAIMSNFFVDISTVKTFPFYSFLSAGIVNFFVPSGGGQWAVQAPIVMPAAQQLGVPLSKAAMAVAWGDQWTNMVQPFWALPALGIAGLGARDVMGYCIIVLFWTGLVASLCFYFL